MLQSVPMDFLSPVLAFLALAGLALFVVIMAIAVLTKPDAGCVPKALFLVFLPAAWAAGAGAWLYWIGGRDALVAGGAGLAIYVAAMIWRGRRKSRPPPG